MYSFVPPVNVLGQSGENLTLIVSELRLLSDGGCLNALLGSSCGNVKLHGRPLLALFDVDSWASFAERKKFSISIWTSTFCRLGNKLDGMAQGGGSAAAGCRGFLGDINGH